MYEVFVAFPDDFNNYSDGPVGRCIGSFKSYRAAAERLFKEVVKDSFGKNKNKEVYIVHDGKVIA